MTNTITFHLKRDLVFLSSLQNTYHNGLNFGQTGFYGQKLENLPETDHGKINYDQ